MLNLISDAWIPVLHKDGSRSVIAPWQMADDALAFPDWPRPDLNIACLELLIGLMFLADPPRDAGDWRARRRPDPARLRAALEPYASAFELMGDGPRFMQDREAFEVTSAQSEQLPIDALFVDCADEEKIKKNSDLFVKRGRFDLMSAPLAALALFTLQTYAPAGGRGHRTSLRGGGPLVTLLDPGDGLWQTVWANVPDGSQTSADKLPWMSKTTDGETSEPDSPPALWFFAMPRRIRLIGGPSGISRFVRKPNGAQYVHWIHPLTPYKRKSVNDLFSSVKASPGPLFYRNWLGTVLSTSKTSDTLRRALTLDAWGKRSKERADIIVAGWAMEPGQAKVRDFTFSRAPLLDLPDDQADRLQGMIEAAEALAVALRGALAPVLAEGEAREAAREGFYLRTQPLLEARLGALADPGVAAGWLADLRGVAVGMFDALALPGLAERDTRDQAEIVAARRNLAAAFAGYGKLGQGAYQALGLPVPEKKGKAA